ncbi:MAG: hypothetical protein LUH10_00435 [Tannerellaceae bacterium]|nr:hypothetical protein [Tannerellaceae bacterium]
MATKDEIKAKVDGSAAIRTIEDLQIAIKKYQNELLKLERGTEDYNNTLHKLVQSQSVLNKEKEKLKISTQDLTTTYANLNGAASQIAEGFNAFQGALSLTGVSSEILEKTFVKLQAALAITKGISAFTNGIKAMRVAMVALNATMAANPVMALALAIATATTFLIAFTSKNEEATSSTDSLNDALELEHKRYKVIANDLEHQIALNKIAGMSELQAIKFRKDGYKNLRNEAIDYLDELNEKLAKADFELQKAKKSWFTSKNKKKALKEEVDILKENIKKQESLITEHDEFLVKIDKDTELRQAEQDQRDKERRKQAALERKKEQERLKGIIAESTASIYATEDSAILESLSLDEINDHIKEQISIVQSLEKMVLDGTATDKSRVAAANALTLATQQLNDALGVQTTKTKELNDANQLREDQKKRINDLMLESEAIEANHYKQQIEREVDQLNHQIQEDEQNKERFDIRIAELALELEKETLTNDKRIELLEEYNKALQNSSNLEASINKYKKKLREEDLKSQLQIYSTSTKLLEESSKLLANDALVSKAIQVASATMSTYTGAAQVLANPAQLSPFVKWAQFATTIATGLSAVKNILAVNIPGGSGSASGSASTPSLPSMPELSTPIQETHNNMDAYDEAMINKEQKVYVVESDVTNVQGRIKVAESSSTF